MTERGNSEGAGIKIGWGKDGTLSPGMLGYFTVMASKMRTDGDIGEVWQQMIKHREMIEIGRLTQ